MQTHSHALANHIRLEMFHDRGNVFRVAGQFVWRLRICLIMPTSRTKYVALAISFLMVAAVGGLLLQSWFADDADPDSVPTHEPPQRAFTIEDIQFPKQNNVFYVSDDQLASDELNFVVEIPNGSPMKYEMRAATGQLFLDRELCPREVLVEGEQVGWVHGYPANYGFAAGRFNEDGDPVDLLVFGSDETYQSMIRDRSIEPRKVRVIGLLKMEECGRLLDEGEPCSEEEHWSQDWKVLAVDLDGDYADLTEAKQLPQEDMDLLERFFSNYKGPIESGGKLYQQTRVAGVMGKSETLDTFMPAFVAVTSEARAKRMTDCQRLFHQRLADFDQSPPSPDFDPDFLACLHEVHESAFFESEENFSFLLNYGAYQLLFLLAKGDPDKMEGITLENAVSVMQSRRDNDYETHFRLVSLDLPEPGLGTPVFEWVKTKNRNDGCPEETPVQHYEKRPLVDFEGLKFREPN